jgi:hypothetical protein
LDVPVKVFGITGDSHLYSTRLVNEYAAPPVTTSYAAFRGHFTDDTTELARTHWLLVEYPVVDAKLLAIALEDLKLGLLFDIAVVGEVVSAFIYKVGFAKIKGKLGLCGVSPTAVMRAQLLQGGGRNAVKEKLSSIFKARSTIAATRLSTMIVKDDETIALWTADLLVDSLQHLTDDQFTRACLDARVRIWSCVWQMLRSSFV